MQEEQLRKLGIASGAPIIFFYKSSGDLKNSDNLRDSNNLKNSDARKDDSSPTDDNYRVLSGDSENPILYSHELRQKLFKAAKEQQTPFLMHDDFELYFACIYAADGFCLIGPMSTAAQSRMTVHAIIRKYQIQEESGKTAGNRKNDNLQFHVFSGGRILAIVNLCAEILNGADYSDEQLLADNHLSFRNLQVEREKEKFSRTEEETDDDEDSWRHSYRQERDMLDAVREGRAEDAVRISREMDEDAGRLSVRGAGHWKNLAVIGITLTARAAIDCGISPGEAYRVSGYYIRKCDSCTSAAEICSMRDKAIRDFAGKVHDKLEQKHTSNYTELCRNYISRHYREKLYLEDVADKIGISPSYLSRCFRKDMGLTFQEYLTRVRLDRASNLLKYSELTLTQIAEYVNFPSQSYFGRVFREHTQMTPKQYRDRFKTAEWG